MGRSGYSEDCSEWALVRWRGAVTSAIRGKRGQAFLREALAAETSEQPTPSPPDSVTSGLQAAEAEGRAKKGTGK